MKVLPCCRADACTPISCLPFEQREDLTKKSAAQRDDLATMREEAEGLLEVGVRRRICGEKACYSLTGAGQFIRR